MRPNRVSLRVVWMMLLLVLQTVAVHAKRTLLPEKILHAKTIFVDNHPGLDQDRARNEFQDAVAKWNRWRIVSNKTDADLIAILTVRQKQPVDPANPYVGTTQLSFVDAATGEEIWANSMAWSDRGVRSGFDRRLAPPNCGAREAASTEVASS